MSEEKMINEEWNGQFWSHIYTAGETGIHLVNDVIIPLTKGDKVIFPADDPVSELKQQITALQSELEEAKQLRDEYATAARVIDLHLAEYGDGSKAYPEHISEAARNAKNCIDKLRNELAQLKAAQEWRDIKEEPEENGRYLVIYESASKSDVFIADYDDVDGWLNKVRGTELTHWKPITPPQTEPEEN